MAKSAHQPQEEDLETQLDLAGITKYFAVLAAAAYATGAVTINTYLHQLGITDFSLAKPKLLLTGILVLTSFLFFAAPLFFLLCRIAGREGSPCGELPPVLELLFPVLALLSLLIAVSAWWCFSEEPAIGQVTVWWTRELFKQLSVSGRTLNVLATVVVAAEIYLPICAAAGFSFIARRILIQPAARRQASAISLQSFHLAVALLAAIAATFAYFYFFALTFYPAIPQAFGGGEPYYESFAVAKEQQCALHQMGVPFADDQPNITQPLPVLHESDALVAFWLRIRKPKSGPPLPVGMGNSNRIVVQLDKSAIGATLQYSADAGPPTLVWPPRPCESKSP